MPEEMMVGEWLYWIERDENALGEGICTQILRPTSMPQHENSCPSVTSQVGGKMPKFSVSLVEILPNRVKSHLSSRSLR